MVECAAFEEGRLLYMIDGMSVFDDDRIPMLMDVLSRRRNVLGKGELATISASLVLTADGVRNYVVLDEIAARKCAAIAGDMPEIIDILGKRVSLNITGTVGLVLHLHELGLISDTEKQDIGFDLETGTFRISEELLKLLR